MYMNCAVRALAGLPRPPLIASLPQLVQVVNSRASTWTAPLSYRANTFGGGQCVTREGDEIVFPAPGPQVQYGNTWANVRPTSATVLANCPYDENRYATVSGQGVVVSPPASSPPAATPPPASSSPAPAPAPPAQSPSPAPAPPASSPVPAPPPSGSCTSGDLSCATDGKSFSQCANGRYVYMGVRRAV
jgi:hypothetical protein